MEDNDHGEGAGTLGFANAAPQQKTAHESREHQALAHVHTS
jgi:hypothetical protein